MKPLHYILVILLALVAGYGGALLAPQKTNTAVEVKTDTASDKKETAFERVMRTRTLRCAYTVFPPLFNKDVNTNEMSGINHDIVEEVAKQLSLKVEWTADVGPAGMLEGLKTNQYDAICVGYSRNPARALRADFSDSMIYLPNSIYVRADDTRFDKDQSLLNSPEYTFNVVDGEVNNFTIQNQFPKAKMLSMAEGAISDMSTRMLAVADGKADAVIIDDVAAAEFIKANPGKVKALFPPITVFTSSIIIPQNEYALKAMLDATIGSLKENGYIKKAILKYTDGSGLYLTADPFKLEAVK